jgi:hypothetical protein
MPKKCSIEKCNWPVFGGGYCKAHQYHRKKNRIDNNKPNSRDLKDVKYFELRKKYLETHKRCMINSPECTQDATVIHHTRGRGIYYLMTETWMPACKRCNNYVESHDQWATENGYKKSRLGKGPENNLPL